MNHKRTTLHFTSRRKFINTIAAGSLLSLAQNAILPVQESFGADIPKVESKKFDWHVGISRRVLTPEIPVWLAGYGTKRVPEGKLHDVWVKVLAMKDASGKRAVMATTDNMGMSKTVYDRIQGTMRTRFGLKPSEFMLTYSHNHCAPCIEDDLVDYYPSDEAQQQLVREYTQWMEGEIAEAVEEALRDMKPARLFAGEGHCTFAVNRRDNKEGEVPALLAEGKPLKGAVDHYVPVLAVKSETGTLLGVLFGYACHPTTLNFNYWCGDYPGFAQIELETVYPGAAAMFFNACGGDQNPLPRRKVELCEKYGRMLSDAVTSVLENPMQPLASNLKTAFDFVNLDYEDVVTREKLEPIASGTDGIQARWAQRLLQQLDDGVVFASAYPYPVQAWKLGHLLMIGIGGEAVVDYSLRFKREFPGLTWVCGYSHYMSAYIPSRRVWEEGGYEGGPHLDEYGHPAWRWRGDVEDRIARTVRKVVRRVS